MFGNRRTARQRLGALGERIATRYLAGLGYRIVAHNVQAMLDATEDRRSSVGEIDIVAYDGATLVFVEVKTRRRHGLFPVARAVTSRKRSAMVRAAARYRAAIGVRGEPYRFDVVTVVAPRRGAPLVGLIRNYRVAPRAAGPPESWS